MNTFQLKAFHAVAACQSYKKAAKSLFISQSYLSKVIAQLEDELNEKLFERRWNEVALTESGMMFLRSSELILNEFERIKRELNNYKRRKEHVLSIAIATNQTGYDLSGPIERFMALHPDIQLKMLEAPYEDFSDLLELRQADVAVGWQDDDDMGRFDLSPLLLGMWGLAVHRDHPFAECGAVEWAEAKNERFVLSSNEHHLKQHIMRCRQYGFEPSVCYHASSLENAILMVSRNFGVALVSSYLCIEERNDLVRFVRLLPENPVSLSIAMRRDDDSPIAREFVDFYTINFLPGNSRPG